MVSITIQGFVLGNISIPDKSTMMHTVTISMASKLLSCFDNSSQHHTGTAFGAASWASSELVAPESTSNASLSTRLRDVNVKATFGETRSGRSGIFSKGCFAFAIQPVRGDVTIFAFFETLNWS